ERFPSALPPFGGLSIVAGSGFGLGFRLGHASILRRRRAFVWLKSQSGALPEMCRAVHEVFREAVGDTPAGGILERPHHPITAVDPNCVAPCCLRTSPTDCWGHRRSQRI